MKEGGRDEKREEEGRREKRGKERGKVEEREKRGGHKSRVVEYIACVFCTLRESMLGRLPLCSSFSSLWLIVSTSCMKTQ